MKLISGTLIQRGKGPILMEPVVCDLTFNRPGVPKVYVLDHDGRRTDKTVPAIDGRISLDGGVTKAVYYEIEY